MNEFYKKIIYSYDTNITRAVDSGWLSSFQNYFPFKII